MSNQVVDNKDCLSPQEVAQTLSEKVMPKKADLRTYKMIALAIAAGAFVAYGAQASLTVMSGTVENLSWGFAKLLGAIVFTTGLMMVVLTGSELFTGNVLMAFSVMEKKVSIFKLLKNWSIVYFGNFIGSIVIAYLVFASGFSHANSDALGVLTLTTAQGKVELSFMEAFSRGILCNWLVCLAVWMASCSRHVVGKIFAIFFPILTFVASGYEHSVANMFYIPSGIFIKSVPSVVEASGLSSEQLVNLNWSSFAIDNLIPVTLGNIVGVVIFVVLLFWIVYLKEEHIQEKK